MPVFRNVPPLWVRPRGKRQGLRKSSGSLAGVRRDPRFDDGFQRQQPHCNAVERGSADKHDADDHQREHEDLPERSCSGLV